LSAAEEACDQIETAIQNSAVMFGPTAVPDGFWPDVEEPVMLSEWVAVAAWVDASGETYVTAVSPPHMPEHHRTGLLYTVLE